MIAETMKRALQGDKSMAAQDNLNCLKNLMQLICCDGMIHPKEKAFLCKAAGQLNVPANDWNGLPKEVLSDNTLSISPRIVKNRAFIFHPPALRRC